MSGCCGMNIAQNCCEDFNYDVKEESDGISVFITPKDSSKTKVFKSFVRSSKELFGKYCGC